MADQASTRPTPSVTYEDHSGDDDSAWVIQIYSDPPSEQPVILGPYLGRSSAEEVVKELLVRNEEDPPPCTITRIVADGRSIHGPHMERYLQALFGMPVRISRQ